MSAPSMPERVTLDAATILERAVDAARDRAGVLFDGLATLDAMGSADHVEVKGEALKWLAEKFGADVREIMNDLDHAQRATVGGVYETSAARYGTPDDDPRFRDMLWHATGGEAGEPAEDRAEAAEAEPESDRRRSVPPAAAEGSGWIAPADPTWPGGLDLRELHRALAGVAGCLAGLDSLGDGGSVIDPEYLGPPIEMLVAWQKRVRDARDMLEAETAGARERLE